MSWFKKLIPSRVRTETASRTKSIPEGVWSNCPSCSAILYTNELARNFYVCPKCSHHFRLSARTRLQLFLDKDSEQEIGAEIQPVDILKFKDNKKYKDRLSAAQKKTNEKDALVAMSGTLNGMPIVASAFDFNFIGGSMGAVVGQRFVMAAEQAAIRSIPYVCFSTSGGARMQEAAISLLQMAKTSASLTNLAKGGIPYISIMTDPTYGGVSASLAMLGDINIAEPNASIGFTGPRVIEQTVREKLPDDFQKSDFLLEHGMIDLIIDRKQMRERVHNLLQILTAHLKK